jgi:hypothetical protein
MKTFQLFTYLVLSILIFSCADETKIEEETTSDEQGKVVESPIEDEVLIEDDLEIEETTFELEDKTYDIASFYALFQEHQTGMINQTVTLKGYYKNHNKQKASGQENFDINVTLYKDQNMDNKEAQAFFIMRSNDDAMFKNIKQGDQLIIKGTIQEGDFFGAPILHDGELVE